MRRLALALLLIAACAAERPESIGATEQAIIGGTDSPPSQDAVVLIEHYDALQQGGGPEGCTGVMLTPKLVLTARHCVSTTDETAACSENGTAISGGKVNGDYKASQLYVFSGNKRPDFISGLGKAARGTEIVTTGADTICNNDVALLFLDRTPDGAKIAPIRVDIAPVKAQELTLVGWGITLTETFPSVRQQRDGVKITDVGPGRALGPAEFKIGEGACAGDSGGPALAHDTGAVIGVLSRGGNGSGGTGADNCIGGESVYSSLFGHKDMLLSAYQKAGQDPWYEGDPNPTLGKLGAGCTVDDACQSNVCNVGANACTQACDSAACPDNWTCNDVGNRKLCVEQKKDGGCSAAGESSSASWSAWLVLALGVLMKRRRAL